MNNARSTLLALLAVVTALCSQPATAAYATAQGSSSAANACQPALPAYEGVIRKRPLAVQNEGATSAFITCSLVAGASVNLTNMYFISIDGQAHTFGCTAVIGQHGQATYLTKSLTVAASGQKTLFYVSPADVGRPTTLGSSQVSFSCQIPPGVAMTDILLEWQQYVGA